jgi:putative ATP-dependent endonuclease of the OLD family
MKPIAIANQLGLPVFVVFDADTDKETQHEIDLHKKENAQIQVLLGVESPEDWPTESVSHLNMCMWKTNLTSEVEEDFGDDWSAHRDAASVRYGHAANLKKNPLAIAFALNDAWEKDHKSEKLESLVDAIVHWAKS